MKRSALLLFSLLLLPVAFGVAQPTLYGTTRGGGRHNMGTAYKYEVGTTTLQRLADFSIIREGAGPFAALTPNGEDFVGACISGGEEDCGTVYRIGSNGDRFTLVKDFGDDDADGLGPNAVLISTDGRYYGTCRYGGDSYGGVIYRMDADGSSFTTLRHLNRETDGDEPVVSI
ncbi:MAG: choice-of-anchor tandem repeat GloVer-containing protein [Catalinimonas sp.]